MTIDQDSLVKRLLQFKRFEPDKSNWFESYRPDTTAVYVGAGTDMRPLTSLLRIEHFVYIDGLPFSAFGSAVHLEDGKNVFSRPKFIPELLDATSSLGFKMETNDGNVLRFRNSTTGKTLDYLVNTALPERTTSLKIPKFQTLIVAGHDPNSRFVDVHGDERIAFVGYEGTVFDVPEDEVEDRESVCFRMTVDRAFQSRFHIFSYVSQTLNERHLPSRHYREVKFDSWKDFLRFAREFYTQRRTMYKS